MTATAPAPSKLPRREFRLTRGELLRAIPKHLGWAALAGAIGGVLLYFINQIHIEGLWSLLLFIPIGAVYVNAAVLPVVIPRRFWSFGYIGMVLLFLLLIIGTILSNKISFPHAVAANGNPLPHVNFVTFWALMTGAMLGLLYGLLAGRTGAMLVGLMLGSMLGYFVGAAFGAYIEDLLKNINSVIREGDSVTFYSRLEPQLVGMIVMLAFGNSLLHLVALIGAALGADRTPATAPATPAKSA
jgi:hypothetical protein